MSERRSVRPRLRTIARHGRQRRASVAKAVVGLVAAGLAVVLVSGASVAAIAIGQLTGDVQSNTVELSHLNGSTAPPSIDAIKGGVNLLLVGTDTRKDQAGQFQNRADQAASSGAGNNDVTILVHIAQDHRSAMVVSFPRDLVLPIPACPNPKGGTYGAGTGMLNTTLSKGGLACPVLTIEKLTGITIPYAASISFDGVAAMSDAVGGVTVCVASRIHDPFTGLDLPAGENTIQGWQALAFLRTRHGVGDGSDLGRISNQQVFLSALARTAKSDGVLTNPIKLYALAHAAATNMQLSSELSHVDTMVAIALALKSIPLSDIVMMQYPVGTDPSNANRVVPSLYADKLVNTALQQDQRVTLTGQTGRGAVLGSSTSPTPAAPAAPSTPAPGASGSPTPAPTDTAGAPVQLPSTVAGQSADQQTCSKGVVVH
jgi:LCP family protein required for cell wall assembly